MWGSASCLLVVRCCNPVTNSGRTLASERMMVWGPGSVHLTVAWMGLNQQPRRKQAAGHSS